MTRGTCADTSKCNRWKMLEKRVFIQAKKQVFRDNDIVDIMP